MNRQLRLWNRGPNSLRSWSSASWRRRAVWRRRRRPGARSSSKNEPSTTAAWPGGRWVLYAAVKPIWVSFCVHAFVHQETSLLTGEDGCSWSSGEAAGGTGISRLGENGKRQDGSSAAVTQGGASYSFDKACQKFTHTHARQISRTLKNIKTILIFIYSVS